MFLGDKKLALEHMRLARQCRDRGEKQLARQSIARAYELDPSLRPRKLALDAATEEQIIQRALRTARAKTHAADERRTPRNPSMRRRTSDGLTAAEANRLFQRGDDHTYRHAMDEADPAEAATHVRAALAHVEAIIDGQSKPDIERLRGYLQDAYEALSDGAEDEDDHDDSTAEERHRAATGKATVEDGVGETRARSVVGSQDSALSGFDADSLFQKATDR